MILRQKKTGLRFFPLALMILALTAGLWGCHENKIKKQGSSPENAGQKTDSVQLLTRQIAQDSANSTLYTLRAGLYLKNGRIDPALRDIGTAIDLNPEAPENFIMLGDIYFVLGKFNNCLASYKKAAQLEPKSEKPLLKLAGTYLMLQDFNKASFYIEQAVSLNPNSSQSFYYRGIQRMETGDTLSSITQLRVAINLDSTNYLALMQAGSLLSAMHDSTAVQYFKDALKARPDDEQALYYLARQHQEQGKFDRALDEYHRVTVLYPDNTVAWYNQGYIFLVEKQDFENAVDAFQQAIAIDPSYVEAVYNLGRTYEAMGQFDKAREQYKLTLKLKSNYPLAIDGMNRLDAIKYPD